MTTSDYRLNLKVSTYVEEFAEAANTAGTSAASKMHAEVGIAGAILDRQIPWLENKRLMCEQRATGGSSRLW